MLSNNYTRKIQSAHPPGGEILMLNGHASHVIKSGTSGTPVVLLHGASANANEFTWTLAPRLDGDLRVMMLDRPGHGYSKRFDGANTLGAQAAQAAALLDAVAPGERAVIAGHSFGGAVALRVALDYPEKVKGVVLIAPVTHDWGASTDAWYNRLASPPVLGHAFAQLVPFVGPRQLAEGIKGVFHPAPVPEKYAEKAATGLLFRPSNFRANARDVLALRKELAAQSTRYDTLKMPVVLFSGSQDTVLSPKLHAGQLKKQIPLELVILPEEGHMPHHGEGEAVANAIKRLAAAP
jgi:pimeloyl-ACP methyl ester carboxylesterase